MKPKTRIEPHEIRKCLEYLAEGYDIEVAADKIGRLPTVMQQVFFKATEMRFVDLRRQLRADENGVDIIYEKIMAYRNRPNKRSRKVDENQTEMLINRTLTDEDVQAICDGLAPVICEMLVKSWRELGYKYTPLQKPSLLAQEV